MPCTCPDPRTPGIRCPLCGQRYEDRVESVDAIIERWDRMTEAEWLRSRSPEEYYKAIQRKRRDV